jgi:tRNA dimethylallyltransferase
MQVYRDLRVLTARPAPEEEARVPHALYGFLPAGDAYSVGRWVADAERAVAEAEAHGRVPVITGGTGLYFKALLEGLSPVPEIPARIRERWRRMARDVSGPELHEILEQRDPVMAGMLRPSDRQRIVRALEVVEATGKSLAEWQSQPCEGLFKEEEVIRILVAPERESLAARIDARFNAMIEAGALDEVRALKEQQLDPGLPVMRALGVAPLMDHLVGSLTLVAAAERVKTETRRYAKRQMTWARRNMISWKYISEKDSKRIVQKIFSIVDV